MKRLPVVGSTAATTSFCHEQLDGPGNLTLWFDGNGKITAGNGTLASPKANAFSLPAQAVTDARNAGDDQPGPMRDCPGSTPTCRAACYVGPLEKAQADLYALYESNAAALAIILDGCEVHPTHGMVFTELAAAWVQEFAAWIVDNAPAGFRFHVSGDVGSLEYAHFIAAVCRASAPVQSWIYTRSFDFLAPLAEVSTVRGGNLALNLSCDVDNFDAACDASVEHGGSGVTGQSLRLCYLTVDGTLPRDVHGESLLYDGDTVFPDYNLRPRQFATLEESPWWATLLAKEKGLVCPVDAGGKSEKRRCHMTEGCNRCLT